MLFLTDPSLPTSTEPERMELAMALPSSRGKLIFSRICVYWGGSVVRITRRYRWGVMSVKSKCCIGGAGKNW